MRQGVDRPTEVDCALGNGVRFPGRRAAVILGDSVIYTARNSMFNMSLGKTGKTDIEEISQKTCARDCSFTQKLREIGSERLRALYCSSFTSQFVPAKALNTP